MKKFLYQANRLFRAFEFLSLLCSCEDKVEYKYKNVVITSTSVYMYKKSSLLNIQMSI